MAIKNLDMIEAGPGFQKLVWRDLGSDDEGTPFDSFANASGTGYSRLTIQVEGVLNGASVELVGSVIPDMYNTLATFVVPDIKAVPPVDMIKPVVVGGDSDTRVTVGLLATR